MHLSFEITIDKTKINVENLLLRKVYVNDFSEEYSSEL